jgi:hypothetical protein
VFGPALSLLVALSIVAPASAASSRHGAALWANAVAAARVAGSLHYVEVSTTNDSVVTIVGDVNRVAGTQTITVRSTTHPHSKTDNGTVQIEVVARTAYVKGDVGGLGYAIGVPSSVAPQLTGKWIAITPSAPQNLYSITAAELTLGSVVQNFAMKGPFTVGSKSRVGGSHVVAVHGYESGTGKTVVHQTFELKASGTPLPLASSSPAVGKKIGKTQNLYSRWGEPVSVTAPTGAIPISSLLAPTTTTAPQVITAAATSISTAPPLGSAATPTAERV